MKYDYKCEACDASFEAIQSMKAEARASCPICGLESRERIITGGSGFILQGGGWYSDGYGNKNQGGNP